MEIIYHIRIILIETICMFLRLLLFRYDAVHGFCFILTIFSFQSFDAYYEQDMNLIDALRNILIAVIRIRSLYNYVNTTQKSSRPLWMYIRLVIRLIRQSTKYLLKRRILQVSRDHNLLLTSSLLVLFLKPHLH